MTANISGFNSTQFLSRKSFEASTAAKSDDAPKYSWAMPTSSEELQNRQAADDAKKPDAVWGEIVSGGKVIAKVYETGGFAYNGNGDLSIDTNISAQETARQLMSQFGGRLNRIISSSIEAYF